jgi:hypothetical protein
VQTAAPSSASPPVEVSKFSRDERPCGSLPAFAWSDVVLRRNSYPTHYRPAFAFSAILCPHRQQSSLRSTCPNSQGSDTGLPCSASFARMV